MTQPNMNLEQELREVEEIHLRSGVRSSPESMAALLADEFVEFGSSGRIFDRETVISSTSREAAFQSRIDDFVVSALAPGAALTTYRLSAWSAIDQQERVTLRSSVWLRRAGRWVLVFHQGTVAIGAAP